MSPKNAHKRRCIVQKLDFENCIITNTKTTTRGRKKLRARITREIEIPEQEEPLDSSPASSQQPEPTSPVLLKRNPSRESPVFFKRRKNTPEKVAEELESSTIEEIQSSPGSPVFKSFKKQKRDDVNQSQEIHKALGRVTSLDMFNSQGNSSSDLQNSYQIDDLTQQSKQSVKISSVESAEVKSDNRCSYSIETDSAASCQSPAQRFNVYEKFESPKSCKRNYKKNSLLGRLQKLQQKQASEKLLWQHQKRKKSSTSLTVSINSFWKEDFNYFIKAHPPLTDSESTFLIVDSRWVPNIKNIKEGSVLELHPPWQKLTSEESAMTVLLNLICLEVVDETKKPVVKKKTTESVPPDAFETNEKLFLDSLFSSCGSGFFC